MKPLVHCQINANGPDRSGLTNPLHRYLAHCAIAVSGMERKVNRNKAKRKSRFIIILSPVAACLL